MKRTLRQRPRISYYEPDEPNIDEYVFCDECCDFVYEYCAIHGPLLVIPDDKVPPNTNPSVPRAALTVPHVFLHIAVSDIPGAGLGIFSTLALPKGVQFGPYKGEKTKEIKSMYCWQLYDSSRRPTHVVDAGDPDNSNWMRYVNCARNWAEQNLAAYQYQGQLYYRTIKIIPRFTELMVFYGSEFAATLQVDLGKYNSPPGYAQKFGAPVPKKNKAQENSKEISTASRKPQGNVNSTKNSKLEQKNVKVLQKKQSTTKNVVKTRSVQEKEAVKINVMGKNISKTDTNNNNMNDVLICDDCGKRFHSKPLLIGHIATHRNNFKDFYHNCSICGHKAVSKDLLEKHMRRHDEKSLFVCKYCNFTYHNENNFKFHLRTHTGEKPFSCDICDYRCNIRSNLKTHLRTHTGEKPFSCDICDYRCNQKINLKTHLRTHTSEKPFSCDICDYRCNQKINLKTHLRTHTSEKPFSCDICDYRCNERGNLKRHLRTHTGEKPFSCDICDYRCNERGNLKRHLRTHTGEKPFSCDICDYRCNERGHLKRHLRTHTGEKPFSCDICDYRCNQRINLKTHLRTHTAG